MAVISEGGCPIRRVISLATNSLFFARLPNPEVLQLVYITAKNRVIPITNFPLQRCAGRTVTVVHSRPFLLVSEYKLLNLVTQVMFNLWDVSAWAARLAVTSRRCL